MQNNIKKNQALSIQHQHISHFLNSTACINFLKKRFGPLKYNLTDFLWTKLGKYIKKLGIIDSALT